MSFRLVEGQPPPATGNLEVVVYPSDDGYVIDPPSVPSSVPAGWNQIGVMANFGDAQGDATFVRWIEASIVGDTVVDYYGHIISLAEFDAMITNNDFTINGEPFGGDVLARFRANDGYDNWIPGIDTRPQGSQVLVNADETVHLIACFFHFHFQDITLTVVADPPEGGIAYLQAWVDSSGRIISSINTETYDPYDYWFPHDGVTVSAQASEDWFFNGWTDDGHLQKLDDFTTNPTQGGTSTARAYLGTESAVVTAHFSHGGMSDQWVLLTLTIDPPELLYSFGNSEIDDYTHNGTTYHPVEVWLDTYAVLANATVDVRILKTPRNEGAYFTGWSDDGHLAPAGITDEKIIPVTQDEDPWWWRWWGKAAQATVHMGTEDAVVTAHFDATSPLHPSQWVQLTVLSDPVAGGAAWSTSHYKWNTDEGYKEYDNGIQISDDTWMYPCGSIVPLTAQASAGCYLGSWTDDGHLYQLNDFSINPTLGATSSVNAYLLNEDAVVTAHFLPAPAPPFASLTLLSNPPGVGRFLEDFRTYYYNGKNYYAPKIDVNTYAFLPNVATLVAVAMNQPDQQPAMGFTGWTTQGSSDGSLTDMRLSPSSGIISDVDVHLPSDGNFTVIANFGAGGGGGGGGDEEGILSLPLDLVTVINYNSVDIKIVFDAGDNNTPTLVDSAYFVPTQNVTIWAKCPADANNNFAIISNGLVNLEPAYNNNMAWSPIPINRDGYKWELILDRSSNPLVGDIWVYLIKEEHVMLHQATVERTSYDHFHYFESGLDGYFGVDISVETIKVQI